MGSTRCIILPADGRQPKIREAGVAVLVDQNIRLGIDWYKYLQHGGTAKEEPKDSLPSSCRVLFRRSGGSEGHSLHPIAVILDF